MCKYQLKMGFHLFKGTDNLLWKMPCLFEHFTFTHRAELSKGFQKTYTCIIVGETHRVWVNSWDAWAQHQDEKNRNKTRTWNAMWIRLWWAWGRLGALSQQKQEEVIHCVPQTEWIRIAWKLFLMAHTWRWTGSYEGSTISHEEQRFCSAYFRRHM